MRKAPMIGLALALSLAACGSRRDAASQAALQKRADVLAIEQIEANWHTAASVAPAPVLVVVGGLGLRVLGGSNARVVRRGTLQLHATADRELETDAAQLRLLLAVRAGGTPEQSVYVGGTASSALSSKSLVIIDTAIASTVAQVGPVTDAAHLGFVPPLSDEAILRKIRLDYGQFSQVMAKIN